MVDPVGSKTPNQSEGDPWLSIDERAQCSSSSSKRRARSTSAHAGTHRLTDQVLCLAYTVDDRMPTHSSGPLRRGRAAFRVDVGTQRLAQRQAAVRLAAKRRHVDLFERPRQCVARESHGQEPVLRVQRQPPGHIERDPTRFTSLVMRKAPTIDPASLTGFHGDAPSNPARLKLP
jgi:hypothetical protein